MRTKTISIILTLVMIYLLYCPVSAQIFDSRDNVLNIQLSLPKTNYQKQEQINLRVLFTNTSNDTVKFVKPVEPYYSHFQKAIQILKGNERTDVLSSPQLVKVVTPGSLEDWITLPPDSTYSIQLLLNENHPDYSGKEYFDETERFIISLEFVQKLLILPRNGEPLYSTKYLWKSNEIELQIL